MNSEKWDTLNKSLVMEYKEQEKFLDIVNDFIEKFPKNFNEYIGKHTVLIRIQKHIKEPYTVVLEINFSIKILFDMNTPFSRDNKEILYKTKILFTKSNDKIEIGISNRVIDFTDITSISELLYNEIIKNQKYIVSNSL